MLLAPVMASLVIGAATLVYAQSSEKEVPNEIQSMALYLSDRLPRELAALKVRKENETIRMEDLLVFDQMHYEGENAMISAIETLEVTSSSRILDIGSGYGGPARYVSWKTGGFVTALELQPEINEEANKMTELVGDTEVFHHDSVTYLKTLVDHQVGDVISWGPATFENEDESLKYDGFMSMLAFLHVDNKKALFDSIGKTLKVGAKFYIEDYFERHELNQDDKKILKDIVSCGPLPSQSEYVRSLELAGFSDIKFYDKTEDWAEFVEARHEIFKREGVNRVAVLGELTYSALGLFYSSVAKLFNEGRLGGTVITGVFVGTQDVDSIGNEEL